MVLVSAASVALVSVAFVVLVQKDAHDHAIWTVAVVSHPVVSDHHHCHSLELVSVVAAVIEIVVVIAHAIHFQLLLFLSDQQVEELGAILVVDQANLEVQGSGGAGGVSGGSRGTSGSLKKVHLGGDEGLVSSPPSFSGVTSRVFLPKHNHCQLTRVKCGAEKVEMGYRTNPHAKWS